MFLGNKYIMYSLANNSTNKRFEIKKQIIDEERHSQEKQSRRKTKYIIKY